MYFIGSILVNIILGVVAVICTKLPRSDQKICKPYFYKSILIIFGYIIPIVNIIIFIFGSKCLKGNQQLDGCLYNIYLSLFLVEFIFVSLLFFVLFFNMLLPPKWSYKSGISILLLIFVGIVLLFINNVFNASSITKYIKGKGNRYLALIIIVYSIIQIIVSYFKNKNDDVISNNFVSTSQESPKQSNLLKLINHKGGVISSFFMIINLLSTVYVLILIFLGSKYWANALNYNEFDDKALLILFGSVVLSFLLIAIIGALTYLFYYHDYKKGFIWYVCKALNFNDNDIKSIESKFKSKL